MLDAYLKIRKGDYSELHGDKERIPSIQPEGPSMFDVAIPNAWHSEWTPQLVITHDFRSGGAAAEKYVTQPVVFDPKNGT